MASWCKCASPPRQAGTHPPMARMDQVLLLGAPAPAPAPAPACRNQPASIVVQAGPRAQAGQGRAGERRKGVGPIGLTKGRAGVLWRQPGSQPKPSFCAVRPPVCARPGPGPGLQQAVEVPRDVLAVCRFSRRDETFSNIEKCVCGLCQELPLRVWLQPTSTNRDIVYMRYKGAALLAACHVPITPPASMSACAD